MSLENKPDIETKTNCPICEDEIVAGTKAEHIRGEHGD